MVIAARDTDSSSQRDPRTNWLTQFWKGKKDGGGVDSDENGSRPGSSPRGGGAHSPIGGKLIVLKDEAGTRRISYEEK